MRIETITSAQNPKIKELLALQEKSRARREKRLFVVEGRRELGHCIDAGFRVRTLFVCREICPERDLQVLLEKMNLSGPTATAGAQVHETILVEIPAALYEKAAYRGGTLRENPLIAVLESVEKPGNLGAVLRSADAAGADAVIICDPLTDLYNPNLIRSSIGAVFSRQVATASSEDTIKWLEAHGIRILTAQLQDSEWYYATDMRGGVAIVMGTESTGLSDIWRNAADAHIRIPMLGQLDSLNVSVSAAILLYEAVRQRNQAGLE